MWVADQASSWEMIGPEVGASPWREEAAPADPNRLPPARPMRRTHLANQGSHGAP